MGKGPSTKQQLTDKSFLTAGTQLSGGPRDWRTGPGVPGKMLHLEPMTGSQGLRLELQAKC